MAGPSQAWYPPDSPSVLVHLTDICAPTPAPMPNSLSSGFSGVPRASAAPRSPQPGPANAPGHLHEQQPPPGSSGAPRPVSRDPVSGSGAEHTSAGGGRGRPERDRFGSARWVRLEAGGARRGWRLQDQKSDSGSGQMSCCLSTARAAAQHSPL